MWTGFAQIWGLDSKRPRVFRGSDMETPDKDEYRDSGLDETESRMTTFEGGGALGAFREGLLESGVAFRLRVKLGMGWNRMGVIFDFRAESVYCYSGSGRAETLWIN